MSRQIPFVRILLILSAVIFCLVLVIIFGSGNLVTAQTYAGEQLMISGDETIRLLVKLDISDNFQAVEDLSDEAILEQQTRIALAQEELINQLSGYDATIYATFVTIPYLAVQVDASGLEFLQTHESVLALFEDTVAYMTLASSTAVIHAASAWNSGYDGSGQTIVIIDTGIDPNHDFFGDRIVAQACFSNPAADGTSLCPNGMTSQLTGDAADSTIDACQHNGTNLCYHGSHVAGIAAGDSGTLRGIAPAADLISIQVFTRYDNFLTCFAYLSDACVVSFVSDQLLALEYVYTELAPKHNIAAINMSLGGPLYSNQALCDSENEAMLLLIAQLRAIGIATIIAAGNGGNTDSIAFPSCLSAAIAVGATTDTDQIASFTDAHEMLEFFAPGVDIVSAYPGNLYAMASGTSMAAPHVAGSWTLLRQRYPTLSVDELLALLVDAGISLADNRPGGTVSKPRIDLAHLFGAKLAVSPSSLLFPLKDTDVMTASVTLSNIGVNELSWSLAEIEGAFVHRSTVHDAGELVNLHNVTRVDEPIVLSHSVSDMIQDDNSFVCNSGNASFFRTFNLTEFGIEEGFQVEQVSFGVETALDLLGSGQSITVNLYLLNGELAASNLTQIGSTSITLSNQTLAIATVPITGTVPANGTLVVEILREASLLGYPVSFFAIGANDLGQSDPTYFQASGCGVSEIVDLASVGFPEMHVVMSVVGIVDPFAGAECANLSTVPWLTVSKTSGIIGIWGNEQITVTVEKAELPAPSVDTFICFFSNDTLQPTYFLPLTVTTVDSPQAENQLFLPMVTH